jgi:hypothetical protein
MTTTSDRATLRSLRARADEVEAVQVLADAAGLPPSTLVCSWIIDRMRIEHGEIDEAEAELHAVQRHLTAFTFEMQRQAPTFRTEGHRQGRSPFLWRMADWVRTRQVHQHQER